MLATYFEAERPLHPARQDQRRETRLEAIGRALVQVNKTENGVLADKAFFSDVINVSANSLRLTAEDMMNSCEVEFWVGVEGCIGKFHLIGEVIWASWEEDNSFHMGIEVQDRKDTDILEWRRVFAEVR